MCVYRGPTDPSRISPEEFREKEDWRRLSLLTSLDADKVSMEVVVEPFHSETPPGEVNLLLYFA